MGLVQQGGPVDCAPAPVDDCRGDKTDGNNRLLTFDGARKVLSRWLEGEDKQRAMHVTYETPCPAGMLESSDLIALAAMRAFPNRLGLDCQSISDDVPTENQESSIRESSLCSCSSNTRSQCHSAPIQILT